MNDPAKVLVALPAGDTVIADLLEAHGHLSAAMLVRGLDEAPEVSERPVYLWHLSHAQGTAHDAYDSCVVAAYTEADAKRIHPEQLDGEWWNGDTWNNWPDWVHPDDVEAERIGVSVTHGPSSVICSSYNAG